MVFGPRRMMARGSPLVLFLGATMLANAVALAQPPGRGATARATSHRGYASYVRNWHSPVEGRSAPVDSLGRPMLALVSINTGDRIEMAAARDAGGFAARDLDRASFVLRDSASGNQHPLEPRLVDLAYRIECAFGAQEIRVLSAYRTPRRSGASNHGKGRALDIVVPGTPDLEVAKFVRGLGFVGVGIYPTSGFVHVDVRDRSYFWSDASGPGKRNRERGILGDLAKDSDQKAIGRGEHGTPPFVIRTDVDATLRALAPQAPSDDNEDEDDDGSPGGG
jgi:uncharacterized protein YcbK (DUF882 family)